MICPNCQSLLVPVNLKNVTVDHCQSCGATFFDENEINRITLSDAHRLEEDRQSDTISGGEKFCPRDDFPLHIYQQESIPQNITLLKCHHCDGIFTFADDLVNFKRAQKAKINYYKIWDIPLPPLKTVLVYSLLLATTVSLLLGTNLVSRTNQSVSNAKESISNLAIFSTGNATLLCFSTQSVVTSEIIFTNIKTTEKIAKTVSHEPTRTHCTSIDQDEIAIGGSILYQIRLLHQGQTVTTTAPQPFISSQ